ncbi:LamG-like jellyroll fold domain-containing protein [Acinetobacter sp. ULE_I010]|uniref:LamG-like jellyroll fold domain-containing protein n=1 Tax=Acinetobacter sp. ULE_I010 TaxID=3373065 RepID=UPI003AF6F502
MDIIIFNPGKFQLANLSIVRSIKSIKAIDLISSGAANNKINPKAIEEKGGIRIEFAQFGDFDSFDILRSATPMLDMENLPDPLISGLTTMYYFDQEIVVGANYYYRVVAHRGSDKMVSEQLRITVGLDFDEYLTNLEPIHSWKLNEISGTAVIDIGISPVNGTFSNTASTALVYRGKVLRKGHEGAAGFAVGAPSISQVNVVAPLDLQRLTLNSFTWFAWVHPTANTDYNWIFANWISLSSGTANMRASSSYFQFPHNSNSLSYILPLNRTSFIAVVYDVISHSYKCFINGTWYNGVYKAPPISVATAASFQFPACGNWNYYGMRGYLSDLTFFDKALSNDDLELLYNLGFLGEGNG